MAVPMLTRRFNVLISTGIWILIGLILLVFQPLSWNVRIPAVFILKQAIHFVLMILCYYVNAKIIVPRYLFRDRIWIFVLWLIGATCLILFISEQVSERLHVFE